MFFERFGRSKDKHAYTVNYFQNITDYFVTNLKNNPYLLYITALSKLKFKNKIDFKVIENFIKDHPERIQEELNILVDVLKKPKKYLSEKNRIQIDSVKKDELCKKIFVELNRVATLYLNQSIPKTRSKCKFYYTNLLIYSNLTCEAVNN